MDRWITLVPCVPQLFGGPWLRAVASELLHHLDDLFGHGEAGVGRQVSSRGGFASANRSLPCAIGGALCGRGSAIHRAGVGCCRTGALATEKNVVERSLAGADELEPGHALRAGKPLKRKLTAAGLTLTNIVQLGRR